VFKTLCCVHYLSQCITACTSLAFTDADSQDIMQSITTLVGPQTPHASLQRVLLAGVAAQAIQVVLPEVASPQDRMSLLHLPVPELLSQV
jgi:hypothetical protein